MGNKLKCQSIKHNDKRLDNKNDELWKSIFEYMILKKIKLKDKENIIYSGKLNNKLKSSDVLLLSLNIISSLNNKEIKNCNNLNSYLSVFFPNINECNNFLSNDSSILNNDHQNWFRKIHDRLNRFLKIDDDNYEKLNRYSIMMRSSLNSKDFLNQSLDQTNRSLKSSFAPILEENGATESIIPKKKKTIKSDLSVKSPRNNIKELKEIQEYIIKSDDKKKSDKTVTKIKEMKKINQNINKPIMKINKWQYSEKVKLLNSNMNKKKQIENKKNTQYINDESSAFDFSHIFKSERKKNVVDKGNFFSLEIKGLIKENNKDKPFLKSQKLVNNNTYNNKYDVTNTNLFLEEIENFIILENRTSMETYANSIKYKKKRKKMTNHSSELKVLTKIENLDNNDYRDRLINRLLTSDSIGDKLKADDKINIQLLTSDRKNKFDRKKSFTYSSDEDIIETQKDFVNNRTNKFIWKDRNSVSFKDF